MNAGQDILTNNTLVQYDSILIVITLPRHVCNQKVLTQSQLTSLGRVTLGEDVTGLYTLALLANGTQVDGHVLVSTTELGNAVFLHRRLEAYEVFLLCTVVKDTDSCCINIVNNTVALGSYHCTAVLAKLLLNTGTYDRSLGTKQGNCLTHHVTAHQCTVSIIMLQEGNQAGSDRSNLLRCHVHQVNLSGRNNRIVIVATALNHLADKCTVLTQGGVTLTDNQLLLLFSTIISDAFGRKVHNTVLYLSIRSLYETEVVDLCIYTKAADKTDVGSFRRLDRTETAIVCKVYVTNLETCTLTRKTARTEGRKTTLVCYLGKGIGLVHELAQGIGTKESVDYTGDGLCINQVCGTEHLIVTYVHALADGTAHTCQTDSELVCKLLAYSTDATVAQVVNIIDIGLAVDQLDQVLDNLNNVLLGQYTDIVVSRQVQLFVDTITTNLTQVITLV